MRSLAVLASCVSLAACGTPSPKRSPHRSTVSRRRPSRPLAPWRTPAQSRPNRPKSRRLITTSSELSSARPRSAGFFEALARLEAGQAEDDVRVTQFGDSHTAADIETAVVRRALQARFGDGGRGFRRDRAALGRSTSKTASASACLPNGRPTRASSIAARSSATECTASPGSASSPGSTARGRGRT